VVIHDVVRQNTVGQDVVGLNTVGQDAVALNTVGQDVVGLNAPVPLVCSRTEQIRFPSLLGKRFRFSENVFLHYTLHIQIT
jgi:hypothetical protein